MNDKLKLYMVMLGAKPKGRLTEQHDIFFGIGRSLKDLTPQMILFWPEAKGKIHIDAWREVTCVSNFNIEIILEDNAVKIAEEKLFFINLGGYKENEFEEYHYKMLIVAENIAVATKNAKTTTFYKHSGFKSAASHIDDKYEIDVDDIYNIGEILKINYKEKYAIQMTKVEITSYEDLLHIGYLKLDKIND